MSYIYPRIKSHYGLSIANGDLFNTQSTDAAGVTLEIPWPCEYVEFTASSSTYGQYGICEEDAKLPDIQNTGDGRTEYMTYTAPGTYRYEISGKAVNTVFITLNKGALYNVKVKMII